MLRPHMHIKVSFCIKRFPAQITKFRVLFLVMDVGVHEEGLVGGETLGA
jgi:hypothetical protein